MPNQPKTPQWTMRLEPALKSRAMAKARAEGRNLSDVVRELIEEWVEE